MADPHPSAWRRPLHCSQRSWSALCLRVSAVYGPPAGAVQTAPRSAPDTSAAYLATALGRASLAYRMHSSQTLAAMVDPREGRSTQSRHTAVQSMQSRPHSAVGLRGAVPVLVVAVLARLCTLSARFDALAVLGSHHRLPCDVLLGLRSVDGSPIAGRYEPSLGEGQCQTGTQDTSSRAPLILFMRFWIFVPFETSSRVVSQSASCIAKPGPGHHRLISGRSTSMTAQKKFQHPRFAQMHVKIGQARKP